MKKVLSLFLTACLLGTICAPALAAEAADARLAAVTRVVKETLDLDTEAYDQFYGEPTENELAPTWDLSWSGESGSLSISATDTGKILSYYLYCDETVDPYDPDSLSFPATTRAQARETAQAFLDRVLDADVESVELAAEGWDDGLSVRRYYFYGTILLHGLSSPLSFRISVNAADGTVRSFSRDDLAGSYFGGIPDPTPVIDGESAARLLAGELSLRLEYVLTDDGKTAVLRYLSNPIDDFYVDGQTGALVNLTQLRRELMRGGSASGGVAEDMNEAFAPEAASKVELTPAELEGAAKLEGVLEKEALDSKARAISELGLSKYTLAQNALSVERQEKGATEPPAVTARLTYTRQEGDRVWRRYVTLDARTGDLISVYSSLPWQSDDFRAAVNETQAQAKAKAFLDKYYPQESAQVAVYDSPSCAGWWWTPVTNDNPLQWSFDFARQANGYFLPAHSLDLSVDASDGSISAFTRTWEEDVTFDSPEGILTQDQALAIYADTFDPYLSYLEVPERLDLAAPEIRPLLSDLGWSFFSRLALGYVLQSNLDFSFRGIDAKTGELVQPPVYEAPQRVAYTDLEGHWIQEAAQALADYNVGWLAERLEPEKALTQWDLVALLTSTQYSPVDPAAATAEEIDSRYQCAYRMGLLTSEEREDGRAVTRMEVVKMLLNQAGYRRVAQLQGIFRTDFADADAIPSADLGYAALAQALGLVSGGPDGAFAPGRSALRAEAVAMLYRALSW